MNTRRIASDPTGSIGRKIRDRRQNLVTQIIDLREQINDLREEIKDTEALIDIIDEAWAKWDVSRLADFKIITPAEARIINEYIATQR